jgi:hypothetical protein
MMKRRFDTRLMNSLSFFMDRVDTLDTLLFSKNKNIFLIGLYCKIQYIYFKINKNYFFSKRFEGCPPCPPCPLPVIQTVGEDTSKNDLK